MKFTSLPPSEVLVGRGRIAWIAREPYREALRTMDAGRITLERGETIGTVKRLLQDAARETNCRIRSSVEPDGHSLVFKKIGAQRAAVGQRPAA